MDEIQPGLVVAQADQVRASLREALLTARAFAAFVYAGDGHVHGEIGSTYFALADFSDDEDITAFLGAAAARATATLAKALGGSVDLAFLLIREAIERGIV